MPEVAQRQRQSQRCHLASPAKPARAVYQSNHSTNSFLIQLQALDNQTMQRLLLTKMIQAKLTVGQPDDKYEQEADRVAEQVMRMPEPGYQQKAGTTQNPDLHVQRLCPECQEELRRQPVEEEEEETVQTKPLADQITPLVQRQVEPAEEEAEEASVQMMLASENQVQRGVGEPEEEAEQPIQTRTVPGRIPIVTPVVLAQINDLRGRGESLPASTRAFFEPRFGYNLGHVRIHTDARAADTARALNARAFTVGRHVVFGAGQYTLGTVEGQRLLAHELTHVLQQSKGEMLSRQPAPDSKEKEKKNYKSEPRFSPEPAMRALMVAYVEHTKGVKENPPCTNRGTDVDKYNGKSMGPLKYKTMKPKESKKPLTKKIVSRCGPAWCAYFIRWCLNQAGVKNPGISAKASSVTRVKPYYKTISERKFKIESGDIFYLEPKPRTCSHPCDTTPCQPCKPASRGGSGHVGFVLSVKDNEVKTVEGNVSINDTNDGVASKTRSISDLHGTLRFPLRW